MNLALFFVTSTLLEQENLMVGSHQRGTHPGLLPVHQTSMPWQLCNRRQSVFNDLVYQLRTPYLNYGG